MKLSDRLQTIFDLATGPELWDVGCDHGHLALFNLIQPKFDHVYCVDRADGAIEKLRSSLGEHGEGDPKGITVVQKDGCHLEWAKVQGTVSIAGVGTPTILKILESAPAEVRHRLTWVLAPQNYPDRFDEGIKRLFPAEWPLDEITVKEGSRERRVVRIRPPLPRN